MPDELLERELMLGRFRRLIRELLREQFDRQCFHRWEVDILLDIETACEATGAKRAELLRRYERAVEKQLEAGPGPPMKLSEYLMWIEEKRRLSEEPGGPQVETGR